MPTPVAITPVYATGDLNRILEIEQQQVEDTVADLNEEQMNWRPNPKAKSALDILWHLAYTQLQCPKPATKEEALSQFRTAYEIISTNIAIPGKLDEPVPWWTSTSLPFWATVWGEIRHRSYHLGELVYLRQVMGLDEPKYFHE